MSKKLLSTALAALMIAGCGASTFAKNYEDVKEDNKAAAEISILSDIGVIKGTSETEFSPDDPVTREQMATLLFRLMLGRDDAGRENTTQFDDLYEPYYNGAISWANAAGYILGTSKNTFNPKGGITKQDAMTMLVRALGQESDTMNAGYPWSYINAAVRLGLDRGMEDVAYTDTLTRAETAKILCNAMTSELLVTKTAQNGAKYDEATSIIEEVFGYAMTDAVLTATNRYAIEGEPVVKNGYVALKTADGKVMTVEAAGMHLDGDADEHLGESFRVIIREENGRQEALSAVPTTRCEEFDTVKIDKNRVKIGDRSYLPVDEYSDELSTNENELKIYAYDEDGVLEQIGTADELKPLLGFYKITMLRGENEDAARRAVLTPYKLGQLDVAADGKVNLAGNRDDADVKNAAAAISGDYVLYYYNMAANELRIDAVLEIGAGAVRRLTATTAKIGDETYDLGNETAGISAQAIHDKLALGANATVVLHHNAIVGVIEGTVYTASSRYLAAVSDAYRIYEDGEFRYIMTAFADGEQKNIYVKDGAAKKGEVYRYTEQDGVYTLIAPAAEDGLIVTGRREFVQKNGGLDEIAVIIREAKNSEIALAGKNTYILKAGDADAEASVADLEEVEFICTDDSVIAVNVNGKWVGKRGAGLTDIEIADGAQIVAVFDNEVGSVETLKYLCVSEGSLGNYDPDATFVRILAVNGQVYEDGRTYTEYQVYDYSKNEIGAMLSSDAELEVGADYRLGSDSRITDTKADAVLNGFVTGYTSGTVSIDGAAYAIGADMKCIRITRDNKLEDVKLTDLYMKNVEFIAVSGEAKLLIEAGDAEFEAEAEDGKIVVTPDFDLADFKDAQIKVTGLEKDGEKMDIDGMTAAVEDGKIVITLAEGAKLEAGKYTVSFTVNSKDGQAEFTVEAMAEEPADETPADEDPADENPADTDPAVETPDTPAEGGEGGEEPTPAEDGE